MKDGWGALSGLVGSAHDVFDKLFHTSTEPAALH